MRNRSLVKPLWSGGSNASLIARGFEEDFFETNKYF